MAVTARNNHSGVAAWLGKNLNIAAKAVANKKPRSFETGSLKIRECQSTNQLAAAAELILELLYTACCVDETLLTSEGGMRVSSNVANHDLIFITVDCFCLAATHSGLGQELVACGDVDECDRVECRMEISFHGGMPSNKINAA
jgi:hypothetical protein